MTHRRRLIATTCGLVLIAATASAQSADVVRATTRDQLRTLLTSYGPTIKITDFKQSTANEWNFTGKLNEGLKNADFFEVVIGITTNKTLMISSYPHYKGSYINVDKVRNSLGLLRQMANLSYRNFIPWAADNSGDIVARFPITLESGFPTESVQTVLRSIANLDQYVGQMRPDIDGSNP